jgi:hypothetical protein
MAKAENAMVVAKTLTGEELTALLQSTGWAEKQNEAVMPRMKLDGNMLTTPDGEMFVYNPAKPKIPACTVRIVRSPEEYWGIWVDEEAARLVGIPEIAGSFSKKYIHADANRRVWPSDEAFDRLKAAGLKASWKGDMQVQIIPEDGNLKGDEPVYILTLSTTSLIEFKGTSKNPSSGSVSEQNFITKLSLFAIDSIGDGDQTKAVIDALTSLTMGGVAAEVRILRAENKELGRTWSVISFEPVHVEPMQAGDLLVSGDVITDDDLAAF